MSPVTENIEVIMMYLEIDTLLHFTLGHFEMKNTKEIHNTFLKINSHLKI